MGPQSRGQSRACAQTRAQALNLSALLEAAEQDSIDLDLSFMIGDRWKDIEAGIASDAFSMARPPRRA